jgi:hypothetical protein
MVSEKIFDWMAGLAVCLLIVTAGCAPVAEEAVKPEVELEQQVIEAPEEVVAEEPVEVEVEVAEEVPEVAEEPAVAEEPEVAPVVEDVAKPEVEPEEEAATLALKFTVGDTTTYKLISDAQRGVKWEGALPGDSGFKGGSRHNRVEMTFNQEILSVNEKGNAVAKITVKDLKYFMAVKDKTEVDFDSSQVKDPEGQFAKMLGHHYTIEITPTGEVVNVVDAEDIRTSVRKARRVPRKALAFLRPEPLKQRHMIPALSAAGKKQLRPGEKWSNIKTFSFGLMGSKSYEKIYTVKDIKEIDGRQVAVVEMNAIPTAETAQQLHKKETVPDFSEEFDSVGTFSGRLEMDLTTGVIEECTEEIESKWTVALPSEEKPDQEPAVLTMTEARFYSLEKID